MQPLLFLLCFMTAQIKSEPGKLTLSTSKVRPFAGELIDLTLTIETSNQAQELLQVPWAFDQPGWQLKHEEWLRGYRQTLPGSLAVMYEGKLLYVPRVQPGEYQLRWKYRLPARVENDSLVLDAVSLGARKTNALHLEVRSLPVILPLPQEWYLGMGPFQVTARWQQPQVSLGDETILELAISGAGDLASIASPQLTELPGWDASKVLLEAMPVEMQQGLRLVRYKVRPRQQQQVLTPLKVRYFHPDQERWMTATVPIPPLTIASARALLQIPTGSTVNDAWLHLPQVLRDTYSLLSQARRNTGWISWAIALPAIILMALFLQFVMGCWQGFTMTPAKRWRLAARATRRYLRHVNLTPEQTYRLLNQFLQRGSDYQGTSDHDQLLEASTGLPVELEIKQLLIAMQNWQFGPAPVQQSVIESTFDKLLSSAEEIAC